MCWLCWDRIGGGLLALSFSLGHGMLRFPARLLMPKEPQRYFFAPLWATRVPSSLPCRMQAGIAASEFLFVPLAFSFLPVVLSFVSPSSQIFSNFRLIYIYIIEIKNIYINLLEFFKIDIKNIYIKSLL